MNKEEINQYQYNKVFIKVGRKVQLDWFKEVPIYTLLNYVKFGFNFETLLPAKNYIMGILEKTSNSDMTYYEVLKIVIYRQKFTTNFCVFICISFNGEDLFIPLCLVLNTFEVKNRERIKNMIHVGTLDRI